MATAIISDKSSKTKLVEQKNYYRTVAYQPKTTVLINETLPFRVRFTNIGIQAYGPGNAAPIGIAIIGLNNYVM
jgi:ABC-type transport system involved in Fe-S cluster assembly fused permease/ATPase subunit